MYKHATLFASLDGGMTAYTSPDPLPLPAGMTRGNRSRFFCEHYPSPLSQKYGGYVTEAGHATDATTRMMERAVSTSLPGGQSLVFQQQFDWWGDLYDGPHPFKVGKADFKFSTHFFNKLSQDDKKRWWDSKVEVLKCVIIDEIERGREGADCFISGKEPLAWWLKLLEAALQLAIAEASALAGRDVTYDIRYASEAAGDLPPLQPIAAGKPAPSCGDSEVQHPCGALLAMSLDHRARLDALTKFVQGPILAGATVTYFQSLTPKSGASYSEAERRTLLDDAKAREVGYKGPSPLDAKLAAPQQAMRTAAISRCGAVRFCGGVEAVEKRLKKPLAQVTDAELSTLLDDVKALDGGYKGPSPLDAKLTAPQRAERTAAISAGQSLRSRGGKELVEKAEAGDEAAQAESKRKASAGLEPEKQRSRGQAGRGAGCGKGSNQSGSAHHTSAEMQAKRAEHRCGCCNELWMSAAKKPKHGPCRSKEGCGLCGPTCPTCGKP